MEKNESAQVAVSDIRVPAGYYRSVMCPGMLFRRRNDGDMVAPEGRDILLPDTATHTGSGEPFRVNSAWTPSTYRKVHAMWAANSNETDAQILPRDAAPTSRPRHGKLSKKLRSLMAWKHATQPDEPISTSWLRYDLHADNDNFDENDEPVPPLLDAVEEIQPSIPAMQREWLPQVKNKLPVEYREVTIARHVPEGAERQAKARPLLVAIGGDVEFGVQKDAPEYAAPVDEEIAPRRDRQVVTRIRGLQFSNGEQVERGPVRAGKKVVIADIRLPAGALVRFRQGKTWRRPSDRFRGAKGEPAEVEVTVGIGGHNPGSLPCPDPVVDREWAADIRKLVGRDTAAVLDLAIEAANFREIGEARGKQGKHAERVGKKLAIEACKKLDAILGANDNGYRKAM